MAEASGVRALTQTKLNRHTDFGELAEITFQNVIQAAEELVAR
jgi:hypothetical protein